MTQQIEIPWWSPLPIRVDRDPARRAWIVLDGDGTEIGMLADHTTAVEFVVGVGAALEATLSP